MYATPLQGIQFWKTSLLMNKEKCIKLYLVYLRTVEFKVQLCRQYQINVYFTGRVHILNKDYKPVKLPKRSWVKKKSTTC